jgi:uncharacterized protein YqeY
MSKDAAAHMRSRLRSDLLTAMRSRRKLEVALIRELVAAIDNAEAPPVHAGPATEARHEFRSGSAEVERLVLSRAEVHALLLKEIEKRERAAAEFERLGEAERADALRAEAVVAKRYVD